MVIIIIDFSLNVDAGMIEKVDRFTSLNRLCYTF